MKSTSVDNRFELGNDLVGVIGRYPNREQALKVAVPGDYLYDRLAQDGGIELWIIGGDLGRKTLGAIRRKKPINADYGKADYKK